MRFLINSIYGSGAGLAWKIQEEGNDVSLFIQEEFCRPVLKGIVPHVNSIEEGLAQKPDLVIFDLTTMGKEADLCRKKGFRVFGGGSFSDLIELDRSYGMKLAEQVGIPVPHHEIFSKDQIKEAIAYIKESDQRYVLKPHGNQSIDLTYVAKDPDDMIHELEWIQKSGLMESDFILQDFMDGYELSTEMWFSNGNPIESLANSTVEQKKFLTGDLGPNTGCETSTVWPYGTDRVKIIDKTLSLLYPILKEMKYTGPLDVNSIVSKEDGEPYFLEWTPRLGYNAIYAFMELLDGPISDFFYHVSIGKTDDLTLKNNLIGMAITLSIPPYPLDQAEKENQRSLKSTRGKPLSGVPDDHIWPADIMLEGKQFVTAGTDGTICYVTSSGKCVEEAEENLYDEIEKVGAPNLQYRIDAGEKAMRTIPELEALGYAGGYCTREELAVPEPSKTEEMVSVESDED